ncbi:MAG: hypothetical protein GY749_29835 [Desulfobacteraceae bacterium]|nr:hypothetical protein [Desulfobacteraceae bacterium]
MSSNIKFIANKIGITEFPDNWKGIDAVLPILEKMKDEGAVIVVKFDGQRTGEGDNGPYTIVVSGQPLGDDFIRIDSEKLEDGLSHVIVEYSEKCWDVQK